MNPLAKLHAPGAMIPDKRRLLMLVWHAPDVGQHAILGQSEHALAVTWQRRCVLDGDMPEIRGTFTIETGRPPAIIERRLHAEKFARGLDGFRTWLGCAIRELLRKGAPLPPGIRPCPGFEPDDGPLEADASDIEYHWSCRNCDADRFVLDVPWPDLYRAAAGTWLERVPRARSTPPPFHGGRLPREGLHVAWLDAGHHCPGVVLASVDDPASIPFHMPDSLLFFYRVIEEHQTPAAIVAFNAQQKARLEAEELYEQERYDDEAADVLHRAIDDVTAVFAAFDEGRRLTRTTPHHRDESGR